MARRFGNSKVSTKLQVIVLATLGGALIPASTAILFYDWSASREIVKVDLEKEGKAYSWLRLPSRRWKP